MVSKKQWFRIEFAPYTFGNIFKKMRTLSVACVMWSQLLLFFIEIIKSLMIPFVKLKPVGKQIDSYNLTKN